MQSMQRVPARAGSGASCSAATHSVQTTRAAVSTHVSKRRCVQLYAKPEDAGASTSVEEPNPGLGLKATWYAAEAFGNVTALGKAAVGANAATGAGSAAPLSREDALAAIRADYDARYFISGVGEMQAYSPECVFADPFVSFSGVGRFKRNVSNLGGMMSDIKLDVYDWREDGSTIETKWRFSCILDLPWKPRLAAAGGTTHVLDPASNLVVKHIERWDVEPSKVVAQLFTPAEKVPTNAAEAFFLAVSDRDATGIWYALSWPLTKLAAPLLGVSLLTRALTGEGLPGEQALAGLVVAGVFTGVWKFANEMYGHSNGGRF